MRKYLFLIFLLVYTIISCAQIKGSDSELSKSTLEIPKLETFKCKDNTTKAHIYGLFPKIINYKGFVFSKVLYCDSNYEPYALGFLYRNRNTRQEMKIVIHDFNDSYFDTNVGIHYKDAYLSPFAPENQKNGFSKSKTIKLFDENVVESPRFAPDYKESDYVCFYGHNKNRYLIEITIKDKKNIFNKSEMMEEFVMEYLSQVKI